MFKTIFLCIIIFLASIFKAQDLGITNLNKQPILVLKSSTCKIQLGSISIIHPINITNLEITVNHLTNLAHTKINNHLTDIVKLKIKLLYSNFIQLRPPTHRRIRSLNLIGTTWKWISGSPDAEDLHIINTTMNNLIESNNQQYKINAQLGNRLQSLTNAVNKVMERKNDNAIILNEIETITTIMNIDLINKILEEIQEAILWTKVSVTNNKLLSAHEINVIKILLEDQGIHIDLPSEALNLVQPKIAVNENTLLYILRVPQLEKEESTVLQIHPLNINNSMIKHYPTHLIKSKNGLFTTSKPDEYIQQSKYTSKYSDKCISNLIFGRKGYCTTRRDNDTDARTISNNLLLINNAKSDTLKTDCGPDDRVLNGNFLISFSNCNVTFKKLQFVSLEETIQLSIMQGALHNAFMHHQLEEDDLKILNNITITNRRMLDHVYLKQFKNQLWNWSLLGGISLSTVLTICLAIFALFHYRQSIRCIINNLTTSKKTNLASSTSNP